MKPSIRRHRTEAGELGEGWDLTRPPFGFNQGSVVNYPSYAAARAAWTGTAPGSASSLVQVEVAGYGPGVRHWNGLQWFRPRWFEAEVAGG